MILPGILRVRSEDNTKIYLKEIRCEALTGFFWLMLGASRG
jgi:hypothetical protein